LLCLITASGIGQEVAADKQPGLSHTIGFNTTGLLNQLLDDPEERFRSPYLVTYSMELGKLLLRAGIGPEYSTETTVHEGFTDSEENTVLRMDSRVGAGLIVLNENRWQAAVGADIVGGYFRERSIEDSGFDRITTQTEIEHYGAGPFFQLDFHLSRRVSLGSECALYWTRQSTTHTQLFENFPDFNTILSENTGSELEVTLPNTVFVRVRF
jgi:hypothetical protein